MNRDCALVVGAENYGGILLHLRCQRDNGSAQAHDGSGLPISSGLRYRGELPS